MEEQHELSSFSPTMPLEDVLIPHHDAELHRRTVRKLDFILLPFLALLFLFNSLDKSNIGNAESAHFTTDIGLDKGDLNTAVALFFAFFVALQPAGAALGRRYGMVAWVPSCMVLWGISTALHVWITARWQLYTLRIIIGGLEAGFYPVTVSYLSLFYTRFEFGRRLSLFYGQAAVGGALGGVLSYFVFSKYPGSVHDHYGKDGDTESVGKEWQSWQVLFMLEGSLTIIVAATGFFWLPHSAETAWFLTPEERRYASERILRDRTSQIESATRTHAQSGIDEEREYDEESRGLLNPSRFVHSSVAKAAVIDDRGLTPHDIISAFLSPKIWHILACNILSAIPVYAFSVFLPLVLAPLTKLPNPALVNLLTAPPYICGAITLYFFASYSDHRQIRILPVLAGLALLLVGLALVVSLPISWAVPRYLALCVLLSGTFIASPLTVAWISGNTPSPGKRALLLGINGWGNLAGLFSAVLFQPKYAKDGYIIPFWWTLVCVATAAAGYLLFWRKLKSENARRKALIAEWDDEDVERERIEGRGPIKDERLVIGWMIGWLKKLKPTRTWGEWLEESGQRGREGDEKVTFVYGL
ncbi:MFS general substrate transporter [Pleomassaria siparia CBS 279.74]|uniref:MFS general substrate transporter n=1 Tax=Pleomassaria siparia CBS 279.74 TaxID=1314801 RepID=A0A6G1JS03_9PLEO|nr:MFS general substrate transporter [Pleomassaria siparia CBS 279.74]